MVSFMKHLLPLNSRGICNILVLALIVAVPGFVSAEPAPAVVSAFNGYVGALESRLNRQHLSQAFFLASVLSGPDAESRLRRGELIVEQLTPPVSPVPPGAMLHHWRGTAFVPGATAADFLRVTRNFGAYPQYFAPQVLQAKVLAHRDDRLQASMRVRQHHIVTVVFDIASDIAYGRLDAQHQ